LKTKVLGCKTIINIPKERGCKVVERTTLPKDRVLKWVLAITALNVFIQKTQEYSDKPSKQQLLKHHAPKNYFSQLKFAALCL
jgi:hypothetical protein